MGYDEANQAIEMIKERSKDFGNALSSVAQDLQTLGGAILNIAGMTSASCSEAGGRTVIAAGTVREAGDAIVRLSTACENFQNTVLKR